MIQANELMIGNYLKNDGVVVKIDARSIFDIWDDKGLKHYSPIPITEQWLLKLGLWKIDENKYRFDNYIIEYVEGWNMYILHYIKSPNIPIQIGKELKYVHQVQNTLFWLTVEELELNE